MSTVIDCNTWENSLLTAHWRQHALVQMCLIHCNIQTNLFTSVYISRSAFPGVSEESPFKQQEPVFFNALMHSDKGQCKTFLICIKIIFYYLLKKM